MRRKFDELFNLIEREGKDKLLEYLEKNGYFTAPCSSQYHLAEEGGLLEHSVNVTELMLELVPILNQDYKMSRNVTVLDESIVIVGLFHDLGKAAYYYKPNYVDNILKSGKRSESKPYTSNKDRLHVPHEVASIHILSKFIQLTEEETFAILYHNGLYTSTGYSLKGNERPLQTLLHFADLWCSRFIEAEVEPNHSLTSGLF